MTRIISKPNCGNSPKMAFLKEFNIAFAKGDVGFISKSVTEDVVWNMVGNKKIEGIEDFVAELHQMSQLKSTELILEQILSHGKEGAVNGVLTMENGKQYAFSDFYVFQSAKGGRIASIISYVIEI